MMEEIALLIGLVLSVAVLAGMAQFSKNLLKSGVDACPSKKLRWIHLADEWGRKLLKTGTILTILAITLGLFESSPHKISVALIIAGLLILILATLIIVPTFLWLPIQFYGFKPLLQKFYLALKNTIPTKATLKSALLGLGRFSLEASKVFIGLFAWSIFVSLRDMENNYKERDEQALEEEKRRQEDDYDYWYRRKHRFHNH